MHTSISPGPARRLRSVCRLAVTVALVSSPIASSCPDTVGPPPPPPPTSPAIALSRGSVTFAATAGGSRPAAQTVNVTNGGGGALSGLALGTITYTGTSGWLVASLSAMTAPATVTLTSTLGSLAAGIYTATVSVSSSASGVTNSPQNITVTLTVNPHGAGAPVITLSPASVTFMATAGGSNPAAQAVTVTNGGGGSLSGLAIGPPAYGTATGWLQASLSGTTAPGTVTLTATLGNLGQGTYSATVLVTSSAGGVTNSPQTIGATFVVSPPSQHTVTLNPQDQNILGISNDNQNVANTVYQNTSPAVGCNWLYNVGFGIQLYNCYQSLLRFDLSSLAGKTIISARLNLSVDAADIGFYPRTWHIYALASTWNSATVTWNIVNSSSFYHYTDNEIGPIAAPTSSGQFSVDLTSFVKNWFSQGQYVWPNDGIWFDLDDYSLPNATSNDTFTLFAPTLTVTYQ